MDFQDKADFENRREMLNGSTTEEKVLTEKVKKRKSAFSALSPSLKRRKVARGVVFIDDEDEKLKNIESEIAARESKVQQQIKIILHANEIKGVLNEEIEELLEEKQRILDEQTRKS